METETFILTIAFAVIAMVYAAVGQAGASGYIAAMGLAGFSPLAMKGTALSLNMLVALIGTVLFLRADRLSWRSVWPFAALGFPFSLLGGAVQLPAGLYYPIVGAVLILSAIQMARTALRRRAGPVVNANPPPLAAALLTGAVIGFVSGTTGTGGGVFLAPVILAMHWGTARQTAATTAVYNLMNSAAALLGAHAAWPHIPAALPVWLLAVGAGGILGAVVGSRYLSDRLLRSLLAVLLLVSGVRLIV